MAPPHEPMLAFAAVASSLYAVLWWLWWTTVDDGIELRYSERDA